MRDSNWLIARTYYLWGRYFSDIERPNNIKVRFTGRWQNKFGHIKRLKSNDTEIVINSLLAHESIPEIVIDATLIHEMCHYVHGFGSPLPKLFRYPHQGNVVKKEMIKRGAGQIWLKGEKWIKESWHLARKNIIKSQPMQR